MKLSLLDTSTRYDAARAVQYGIQTFGERNDYPQRILEILAASVTGGACCNVYQNFIIGKGFRDERTYQMPINHDGETLDDLLQLVAFDLSHFGGFAMHINYNANCRVSSIHHVPFENVRLGLPSEDNGEITNVKIHPDWGRRKANIRRWRKDDIDTISLFDPTTDTILAEVANAGGWDTYKGQIYYYSRNGKNTYPLPIFDAAITDMSTEEAIADITNRNAANGFLPAGLLVDICQDGGTDTDEPNPTEMALQTMQGSKNAAKVAYAQVATKEEIPQFVQFAGTNYDKEFTASRDAAKDAIGRAFNQPPILRAENVGAGFGAEIMQQAYNYYNSTTTNERLLIERVLTEIFKYYVIDMQMDFTIEPLSYEVEITLAERLGERLPAFNDMLANETFSLAQKRAISRTLYGLAESEINDIFPILHTSTEGQNN